MAFKCMLALLCISVALGWLSGASAEASIKDAKSDSARKSRWLSFDPSDVLKRRPTFASILPFKVKGQRDPTFDDDLQGRFFFSTSQSSSTTPLEMLIMKANDVLPKVGDALEKIADTIAKWQVELGFDDAAVKDIVEALDKIADAQEMMAMAPPAMMEAADMAAGG